MTEHTPLVGGASPIHLECFLSWSPSGRLNLLVELLDMPARVLFNKVRGQPEFKDAVYGIGDVLSHLGVYMCVYVVMYECMHVVMYVCMYIVVYVCVYVVMVCMCV